MKQFMDENFLLKTKTAQILYHDYAKDAMIYDYHCHLIPQEIAENKRFTTITDAWLGGDHYKWRAMRANGVDEALVTGKNADPFDKFVAWADTRREKGQVEAGCPSRSTSAVPRRSTTRRTASSRRVRR